MDKSSEQQFHLRVLFVEDEGFTSNMVSELLTNLGVSVRAVKNVAEAISALPEFTPNVVVTDLDLGEGPTGSDLLNYLERDFPWIGKVILTSHASPELALGANSKLPKDVTFLIKSLVSAQDIHHAIVDSLEEHGSVQGAKLEKTDGMYIVSRKQAELLKLLGDGLSNSAIAEARNRTLKATESMIHRLFASLEINADPNINPRVVAVRLWQQGKVLIK